MPRYCLFGNTVNLTSRTETTGTAGRINVSQDAYKYFFSFFFFNLFRFSNGKSRYTSCVAFSCCFCFGGQLIIHRMCPFLCVCASHFAGYCKKRAITIRVSASPIAAQSSWRAKLSQCKSTTSTGTYFTLLYFHYRLSIQIDDGDCKFTIAIFTMGDPALTQQRKDGLPPPPPLN